MPIVDRAGALARAEPLVRLMEDGTRFYGAPYWDSVGEVWTIGTGHTLWHGVPVGPHTKPITPDQDDAALADEFAGIVDMIDNRINEPMTACQGAALIDLAYNVGDEAFYGAYSIAAIINLGDVAKGADAFAAYCHARGRRVTDLVIRRALEREVFLGHVDPLDQAALVIAAQRIRQQVTAAPPAPPAPSTAQPTDELDNLYNPGA